MAKKTSKSKKRRHQIKKVVVIGAVGLALTGAVTSVKLDEVVATDQNQEKNVSIQSVQTPQQKVYVQRRVGKSKRRSATCRRSFSKAGDC